MKPGNLVGPILLAAAVLAVGYLAWRHYGQPEAPETAPAADAGPVAAAPQFPIEAVADEAGPEPAEPLPPLAESDAATRSAIAALLGQDQAPAQVVGEQLIERIVVSVDNLPSGRLPLRALPLRLAPGRFRVTASESGATVIDPGNFARYDEYVAMIEAVDVGALVDQYVRAYPLFQEAYRGLGYPDGHFNDRLVAVLDHLLATPTPAQPIVVVPEKDGYTYADPALAALSSGQKLLIRIGPDHAATIKAKLRELRAALAGETRLDAEPAADDPGTAEQTAGG